LSSIKTIHAFGAQSKIVNKYDEFLEEAHQESKKLSVFFGILFSGQTFFVMSGTALAFWQGYRMFRSGEIASVGTVFVSLQSIPFICDSGWLTLFALDRLSFSASLWVRLP